MPKPKVRDKILAILEAQRGLPLSGQQLAEQLGITRAAVWKVIDTLRKSGCVIEGTPNKGYVLKNGSDLFTAAAISAGLQGNAQALQIQMISRIGSTNAALKEQAQQGAAEGVVLAAAEQTSGRGRMGRSFYSPAGTGLYLSILLRPTLAAQDAPLLTAAAAASAAQAAEDVGSPPLQIKWVNDLQRDGKKVCGILTEAALDVESGFVEYAVLGVGFNLTAPTDGWAEELEPFAGSLFDAPPPAGTRAALAAAFLNRFWAVYETLPNLTFLDEYRRRQILISKTVEVCRFHRNTEQPQQLAKVLGVDDRCRLLVQYTDGRRTALSCGEVRVKPSASE